LYLFGRVDRAADGELALGNDPFGLVADVDQDLVLVDANHLARDDVAFREGDDRGVVVRNQLPIDLDHEVLGHRRRSRIGYLNGRVDLRHARNYSGRVRVADRVGSLLAEMPIRQTKRGSERTLLHGDHDVVVCGASFAGLATARELAGA